MKKLYFGDSLHFLSSILFSGAYCVGFITVCFEPQNGHAPARKDCQEIIAHGLTMEELESEARQERHGAACAQVSPWLFFCQV